MIYWITRGEEEHWISRANSDGTGVQIEWMPQASLEAPEGEGGGHSGLGDLAVSEDYVFYGQNEDMQDEGISHLMIGRFKRNGTEVDPHFIECVVEGGSLIEKFTIQGNYIYFFLQTNVGKYFIGRAKLDGTEVEPEWLEAPEYLYDLTVNADHLYFAYKTFIGRVKLDGTGMEAEWTEVLETPEGGDEISWRQISANSTHIVAIFGYWHAEEEVLETETIQVTIATKEVTVLTKYTEEESFLNAPFSTAADDEHFYVGGIEIGRYTAGVLDPDWIVIPPESDVPAIAVEAGGEEGEEEEPEGATVQVKVGGELVTAKRYVKVGGELVSA